MAISLTHYQLLKLLKDRGELPQGGRILEIGKANWYGDAPPSVVDPSLSDDSDGFSVVDRAYELLFGDGQCVAYDIDPAAHGALRDDLNTLEVDGFKRFFGTVINHGTAEHVFNIANVFKVMHDACEVGGLLIHESPYRGWDDHGFFSLQPNLFEAVARENRYDTVLLAVEHLRSRSYIEFKGYDEILEARRRDQLPDHAMLFVAMRKTTDAEFRIPTQAIYSGAASPFRVAMWRELR